MGVLILVKRPFMDIPGKKFEQITERLLIPELSLDRI